MKKNLLYLFLTFLSTGTLWSQCVPTCSNYAVSPITFTTFPSVGSNTASGFTPNLDDGITPLIPIGFNFNFYCTTYTDLWICTNGFIQFNNGVPAIGTGFADATQSFPSLAAPNAMVALNMNDLDGNFGTITYTTIGVTPNQRFIVTYSNVPVFGYSSNTTNGQIVLYETTNIIEIYTADINNNGLTAGTQGIEDATGLLGVPSNVSRNNSLAWAIPITNTAYRFSPFTPTPPSAITGNTLLCQGDPSSYQATFIASATGYNWTLPSGWLGTSTISALTATTGASGNLTVTATYSCGTSAPTVLGVSVTPGPLVSITSVTPSVICAGKTTTFNTTGAVSYTLNPGGIMGMPPFTDMPLITTVYTLTGTSPLGCVSVNNPMVTVTVKETPIVSVNSGSICLGETFTLNTSGSPSYSISGPMIFLNAATPTLTGQFTYSVVGTGTNGCKSDQVTSSLIVYGLPTVGATATRTVMCRKESVVLTATGAATYLWGNSSVSASFSVSPTTNTFYTVIGTDANGCANSATVNITVNACTGIAEAGVGASNVKLYPNPTTGIFEVKTNAISDKTFIEIYNALGQLIAAEKVQSEITVLNLKGYSDGLYYVKIKNAEEEYTVKLIKQ